jgi:hypothetical protein
MMELSPLQYTLNNIVVGWGAAAISFAQKHGYHLIVNSEQRPFCYLVGHEEVKSRWFDGVYRLGMAGLLPVPFEVETVALEEGRLKIITRGNTKVLVQFQTLHLFDGDNFKELPFEEVVEDHTVYDVFDITQGSRLGDDFTVLCPGPLMRSIKFVKSNRIDRNKKGDFKDILVRSVIPDADLKSFDFSETVVRILLERTLKEHNIQSADGLPIKVSHSYRHTTKNNYCFKVAEALDPRIILHG